MATPTTNYGLLKPAVNDPTDQDLWGGELNGDMDELDVLILTAINWAASPQTSSFSVTAPTPGSSATGSAKTLFLCDATSGSVVGTLPSASSAGNGFPVAFKKMDSGANTVVPTAAGSDKIDGASTFVISAQYAYVVLVSDGTSKWSIVSQSAVQNVRPGTVIIWPTDTAPAGYLECDGSAVSRSTYAALFSVIGTFFGAGNGTTTFNLLDMKGYFPRGWSHGGSIDSGRSFGSTQQDSLQNITGTFYGINGESGTGAFGTPGGTGGNIGSGPTFGGDIVDFDASRIARTSSETRSINIALMFCMKT